MRAVSNSKDEVWRRCLVGYGYAPVYVLLSAVSHADDVGGVG